ncbi:hypothetical protein EXU57_12385 [Segetibacter sp. 3557_3]|uniref:hypothetical protein n=1 Tax=Segetibacter sp. 3557_3 TaxID=2547429 RepID=UPI001058BDF7|nr:hypothetical protein [Segetibacter sp. 3557_3]TDH25500.1 hypothetical protein EXU57_12385 [Segetibacter sp. 3557_3]
MFYPAATIEELMPDVLIQDAYNGLGTPSDRPKYQTRANAKLGRIAAEKDQAKEIKDHQNAAPQQVQGGTRGVVPESTRLHPTVDYTTRYGSLMLNGLENSPEPGSKNQRTNNGSWKP